MNDILTPLGQSVCGELGVAARDSGRIITLSFGAGSGDLAGQIYIGQWAWHPAEHTKSIMKKRRCKEPHTAFVLGAEPQCQGNIGKQTLSGHSDAWLLPLILQAEARCNERPRAIGATVEMVALQ